MKFINTILLLCITLIVNAQNETVTVNEFNKITISPHIEVEFKKGNKQQIEIIENHTALNIKVKGKTLHLYLNGAKITSPTRKEKVNNYMQNVPIYKGTLVKAVITYTNLNSVSLRGEQQFLFTTCINQNEFKLKTYGEPKVVVKKALLTKFKATLYGEGYLKIKEGDIKNQKITVYGEGKVTTSNVKNEETKLTAYGDANFKITTSKKLKVTSFGEANVLYKGNPKISKGIVVGDTTIEKL